MKIADRMEMLLKRNQSRKAVHGLFLTPNEKLMAEACDAENAALEQRLMAIINKKVSDTTKETA